MYNTIIMQYVNANICELSLCHIFFLHSSKYMQAQLRSIFWLLKITLKLTGKYGYDFSMLTSFSLEASLAVESLHPCSTLTILKNFHDVFHIGYSISFITSNEEGPLLCCLELSFLYYILRYRVMLHCCSGLYFRSD